MSSFNHSMSKREFGVKGGLWVPEVGVGTLWKRAEQGCLPGGREKALQGLTSQEASTLCCPGGVGFLRESISRRRGVEDGDGVDGEFLLLLVFFSYVC